MVDLLEFINPGIIALLSINIILLVAILWMNLSTKRKLRNLTNKYNRFMTGSENRNMEELMEECIAGVKEIKAKSKEVDNHINYLERNLMMAMQKTGVVRYNAFENVGSDLSFSIALLDSGDTGLILSSIFSRDSSITYAKPVIKGKSNYPLSAEEMQALDIAKKSHGERLYKEKIT